MLICSELTSHINNKFSLNAQNAQKLRIDLSRGFNIII